MPLTPRCLVVSPSLPTRYFSGVEPEEFYRVRTGTPVFGWLLEGGARPCLFSAACACPPAERSPAPTLSLAHNLAQAKDPRPLVFSHFAAGHGGDATYNEVSTDERSCSAAPFYVEPRGCALPMNLIIAWGPTYAACPSTRSVHPTGGRLQAPAAHAGRGPGRVQRDQRRCVLLALQAKRS